MNFIEGFNPAQKKWIILYHGPDTEDFWEYFKNSRAFAKEYLKLIEVKNGKKIVVDRIYPRTLDD